MQSQERITRVLFDRFTALVDGGRVPERVQLLLEA